MARPLPIAAQVALVAVGLAVVVLATPTGLFLREQPVAQLGEVWRSRPFQTTMEERRFAILGPDYRFLAQVRDATPPGAVILMSDQFAPSVFDPGKGKKETWASHVLHPRRVLYLHQEEDPRYREARWLIVDDRAAVEWIVPSRRPRYEEGRAGIIPFDMGDYLDTVDRGEIDRRYLPPTRSVRPFSLDGTR